MAMKCRRVLGSCRIPLIELDIDEMEESSGELQGPCRSWIVTRLKRVLGRSRMPLLEARRGESG